MEKWQQPEIIALWFGIVLLFVLLLVFSILYLVRLNYRKIIERSEKEAAQKIAHQRALLENSMAVQERERDRIASDLHDGLIGKLTVVKLHNQMASDKKALDELIGESITVARGISHDLSPPLIAVTPFHELAKDVVSPWGKQYIINSHINISTAKDLSSTVKLQFIRIMQEIITNINKHAEASEIFFYLRHTSDYTALYIGDNGKGVNPEKIKAGLGLKSIESRVQFIGARYKFRSDSNYRTTFIFLRELENE